MAATSAQAGGLRSAGVTVGGVMNPAYGETVSTSPWSAAPGEGLNVSGSGFTPGDTVNIEFGGETTGTAKVDANGMTGTSKDTNYTATRPPPPVPTPVATPRAPYYVPRVSSTPGSAPAGGSVTFSGEGFRPGELVTTSFGGSHLWGMRSPAGLEMFSTGTYQEIVPNERFVATGAFADKDGNLIPMGDDHPVEITLTMTLEDLGDGKTKMTLRQSGWADPGMAVGDR